MDMLFIISRNLVKFRSIFINIGAKNDEIDENIGIFFLQKVWLDFCKNLRFERCKSVYVL